MEINELIKGLCKYQKWRRGAKIPQPDPKELGILIDKVIRELRKIKKNGKSTY